MKLLQFTIFKLNNLSLMQLKYFGAIKLFVVKVFQH